MTGSIVGTPHYMSPEQVQGQPVDGRSDQFSLAVIAFEMLTGEKPYTGEHLTTVVYKIVAEEPPSPQRINASLGSAIENVLRKGLAKKPDARYASCQEFTEALEKACAASKGWQSLPRGGSLNAPTVVDKQTLSAPVLPPARRARRADLTASSTTERTSRRRSGFLPFLAAILMAAALLAVVAWQVKPGWLLNSGVLQPKPSAPAELPKPQTPTAAPPVAAAPIEVPGLPVESKPSPMPGAPHSSPQPAASLKTPEPETPAPSAPKSEPRAEAPVRRSAPPRALDTPQPVAVVSSPKGAVATMDGEMDTACATPCTLQVAPGHHSLEITKPGYDLERRDVEVGDSAVELPAVVLHQAQGTLMLTSDPIGAAVLVDGKRQPQVTPAQIQLAPGSYSITVEWKDGKQATRTVQIKDGINYQKFLLGK